MFETFEEKALRVLVREAHEPYDPSHPASPRPALYIAQQEAHYLKVIAAL